MRLRRAFRPPRASAQARSWLWRALDRAVDGSVPVPHVSAAMPR